MIYAAFSPPRRGPASPKRLGSSPISAALSFRFPDLFLHTVNHNMRMTNNIRASPPQENPMAYTSFAVSSGSASGSAVVASGSNLRCKFSSNFSVTSGSASSPSQV